MPCSIFQTFHTHHFTIQQPFPYPLHYLPAGKAFISLWKADLSSNERRLVMLKLNDSMATDSIIAR